MQHPVGEGQTSRSPCSSQGTPQPSCRCSEQSVNSHQKKATQRRLRMTMRGRGSALNTILEHLAGGESELAWRERRSSRRSRGSDPDGRSGHGLKLKPRIDTFLPSTTESMTVHGGVDNHGDVVLVSSVRAATRFTRPALFIGSRESGRETARYGVARRRLPQAAQRGRATGCCCKRAVPHALAVCATSPSH